MIRLAPKVGAAALLFLFSNAAIGASSVPSHAARSAHGADIPRLFLSGPATILLALSCLAVAALIVFPFGGLDKLTAPIAAGARRLEGPKTLLVLWGVCVSIILLALAGILFATKILAALGVIVLLIAFALFGAGLATAAIVYGRATLGAVGSLETDDLACLRHGLWLLFFASFLPFLGWLVVLLAAAGGLGAFVQSLLARPE